MADNQTKYDLIEQYLENKLKGTDKTAVEDLIQKDPQFQKEVRFQKEVIDSLKSYRKLELKNRLSGLPVQSSLIGSLVSSSIYFKPALVASVAGIVGLGIYFTNTDTEKLDFAQTATVEKINEISISGEILEPMSHKKFERLVLVPKKIKKSFKNKHQNEISSSSLSSSALEPKRNVVRKNIHVDINIDNQIEEDEEVISNDLEKSFENKALTSKNTEIADKIEISTIAKDSKTHEYKFSKGQLFLSVFEDDKYEIFEINRDNKNKEFILLLNGKYYELNNKTRKLTPITPITDLNRIQEIELLK